MQREGPPLELLTRRLAETPADFLAAPRIGTTGSVETAAVVGDLAHLLRLDPPTTAQLAPFLSADPARDRNRLCLVLLLCWLLADDWFRTANPLPAALYELLGPHAAELAADNAAHRFVADPDRREELARLTLARLGCRPAGETIPQAQDRLTTISSTERNRVMLAARAAEERARAVREALARKAAQESADKYTRE